MTKTITVTENKDLRISWEILKEANFPTGKFQISIKKSAIFIIPQVESQNIRAQDKIILEQELAKALQEVEAGKMVGPFNTISELRNSLER